MTATANFRETEPERESYRAVSGWSVAALLLGLGSVAAFGGPLLWVVPLAGVVAALVAMHKIGNSPGELIGRNVALLGLLLAMLFGVAAVTRTYSRQHWLERRGELFASEFLRLLQKGDSYAAHQLTVQPGVRKPLGADGEEAYASDPESKSRYQAFIAREPNRTLLQSPDRAAEIESVRFTGSDSAGDYLDVIVRVTTADSAGQTHDRGKLILLRSISTSGDSERWQIVSTDIE